MNIKETEKKFAFFKEENKKKKLISKSASVLLGAINVFFVFQAITAIYSIGVIAQYNKESSEKMINSISDYTNLKEAMLAGNQDEIVTYFIKLNSNKTHLSDSISFTFSSDTVFKDNKKLSSEYQYKTTKETHLKLKKLYEKFQYSGHNAEFKRIESLANCNFIIPSVGCSLIKSSASLEEIDKDKSLKRLKELETRDK